MHAIYWPQCSLYDRLWLIKFPIRYLLEQNYVHSFENKLIEATKTCIIWTEKINGSFTSLFFQYTLN